MEIISRQEAIAKNLKEYFTGKPCKYGHLVPKHTKNSTCIECQKIRISNWQARNKKICATNNRKLYLKQKQLGLTWYHKNKKAALEYNKKYRSVNRELIRSIQKSYVECHPEKRAETSRTSARNRRAKVLDAGGVHSHNDVLSIYFAQKGRCAYCKVKVGKKYHVDHIVPISKGGTNGRDNLQICCPTCNLRKNAKDPIEFAQELGFLI